MFRTPLIVLLLIIGGCQQYGPLVKRRSELCCPTDIRQTVPWCAGEDALFRCPCGPNREFYGHKPTCWRTWSLPGAQWRDAYCGPVQQEYIEMPGVPLEPLAAPPADTPPTTLPAVPAAPVAPPDAEPMPLDDGASLVPSESAAQVAYEPAPLQQPQDIVGSVNHTTPVEVPPVRSPANPFR